MTDLRVRPTDTTDGGAPPVPTGEPRSHYRPPSRRRRRIAAGVALAAAAIAGNVFVYAGLDEHAAVVQVVRDVPAGEQLRPDMLRAVEVELDDSVAAVPADDLGAVAGQYAKVRLVAGSLVTQAALQADPLVAAGSSVVAVELPEGALPVGLRERSPVELVIPAPPGAATPPVVVRARTVGLPRTPGTASPGIGTTSLSVEVAAADAATVAAADDVRIVLVEPRPDRAIDSDSSSRRERSQ